MTKTAKNTIHLHGNAWNQIYTSISLLTTSVIEISVTAYAF